MDKPGIGISRTDTEEADKLQAQAEQKQKKQKNSGKHKQSICKGSRKTLAGTGKADKEKVDKLRQA